LTNLWNNDTLQKQWRKLKRENGDKTMLKQS